SVQDGVMDGELTLRGGAGNDTILGGANVAETMIGGAGADVMIGNGDTGGGSGIDFSETYTLYIADLDETTSGTLDSFTIELTLADNTVLSFTSSNASPIAINDASFFGVNFGHPDLLPVIDYLDSSARTSLTIDLSGINVEDVVDL